MLVSGYILHISIIHFNNISNETAITDQIHLETPVSEHGFCFRNGTKEFDPTSITRCACNYQVEIQSLDSNNHENIIKGYDPRTKCQTECMVVKNYTKQTGKCYVLDDCQFVCLDKIGVQDYYQMVKYYNYASLLLKEKYSYIETYPKVLSYIFTGSHSSNIICSVLIIFFNIGSFIKKIAYDEPLSKYNLNNIENINILAIIFQYISYYEIIEYYNL